MICDYCEKVVTYGDTFRTWYSAYTAAAGWGHDDCMDQVEYVDRLRHVFGPQLEWSVG